MTVRILRWATGCVAAASVALLAGAVALSYADRHLVPASGWDFSSVLEEATFIVVPAVGFVLASRRPGNRVGWIFLGGGLVLGLGFFCERYGQRGLIAAPGSLPAARAAAWFVNWAWAIPVAVFGFMLLLFPTGRLASRRWRPAAWFAVAVYALEAADMMARACRIWANPYTPLSHGWYPGSHTADVILVPAALLAGVAAVAVRFARSSGEERLQLKSALSGRSPLLAGITRLVHDQPEVISGPLAGTPRTFVHGDWKMGNLGSHPDGRTILLDWALPGSGPACWDLCWYLALNRARLPEPKESVIGRFRAELEARGIGTDNWWEPQLDLCMIGIMATFGWEKALGDARELRWWEEAVARAVARRGVAARPAGR